MVVLSKIHRRSQGVVGDETQAGEGMSNDNKNAGPGQPADAVALEAQTNSTACAKRVRWVCLNVRVPHSNVFVCSLHAC